MHPILLKIGPFTIHSYGVMLALGSAIAIWWASKNSWRAGIQSSQVMDVGIVMVLLGLVGARLAYVALNWSEYALQPAQIFAVWDGGLTFFGGLILGGTAGAVWALVNSISISKLADLSAPAIAVAYSISRIGCFLNGCCYGHACNLPWAIRFHANGGNVLTAPSHPAQLYSSLLSLLLFFVLLRLMKMELPDGQLFGIWVVLSAFERFIVELFRRGATAELFWGTLTQAQAFTCLLAVAGIIMILRSRRKAQPSHVR